ncbi:hypothetical protein LTR85_001698 [Meristemomyces frigidus]|nr:hypothetical protein LTR85_001698 [Meristemomyces frigidus]
MTKMKFSLDYHDCTTAQLQHFIKTRTGQSAKWKQKKPFYISILRQADRDATFRFLDLAPELRNLVYRELLTWTHEDGANTACYPQILAASKQVHSETESILYGDTPLQIRLAFGARRISGEVYGSSHVVVKEKTHSLGTTLDLRAAFGDWPSHLRRMQHIHVKARFVSQVNQLNPQAYVQTSFVTANHIFYTLASHLSDSNKLKKVTLEIEGGDTVEFKESASKILSPFAKLDSAMSTTLVIKGAPAEATEALLQRMQSGDKQQTPAVKDCKQLLVKALNLQAAAAYVSNTRSRDVLAERVSQLQTALASREYMDDYLVRVLADAAAALQLTLDQGLLAEVKGQVKTKIATLQQMEEFLA